MAHLPDIPNEAQKVTDIDQEIEERLLRLKFFNQSWLQIKNSNSPQPIDVIDMGDDEMIMWNVDVAENSVETETFTELEVLRMTDWHSMHGMKRN